MMEYITYLGLIVEMNDSINRGLSPPDVARIKRGCQVGVEMFSVVRHR